MLAMLIKNSHATFMKGTLLFPIAAYNCLFGKHWPFNYFWTKLEGLFSREYKSAILLEHEIKYLIGKMEVLRV